MVTHPDEAHIKARQEKYRQAINSGSIDEAMSFFSEDVHFSDFGISYLPRSHPLILSLLIGGKVSDKST
jgi:hypothetical protein